jgi:integrase
MLKTRESNLACLLFKKAAAAWLETRRPFLSPRSFEDYGKYIETLALFFGELKLTEIAPDHLRAYQKIRMARAGGRRINQELGVIQQILKRIGRWQDVGFDYQRLPEPKQSPGRALSDQEYARLFRVAQSRPEWEMAYLFAAISVNTTCGPKEVYTLRLRDINLEEGFLRVQPDGAKNAHRIRIIPLNPIARAAIERVLELAGKRGSKQPDHYLFPFRVRGNGTWGIYDPTQRCKSCQGAWRKLLERAPTLRPSPHGYHGPSEQPRSQHRNLQKHRGPCQCADHQDVCAHQHIRKTHCFRLPFSRSIRKAGGEPASRAVRFVPHLQ